MTIPEYTPPTIEREFFSSANSTACIAMEYTDTFVDLFVSDGSDKLCYSYYRGPFKGKGSEEEILSFVKDMELLMTYASKAILHAKRSYNDLPTKEEYDAANAENSHKILEELDKDGDS